jgi:hypothetical protein
MNRKTPNGKRWGCWLERIVRQDFHRAVIIGIGVGSSVIVMALACRAYSIRMANGPDYTESLNQSAANRDPRKPENPHGNVTVERVPSMNAPVLLTFDNLQKISQFFDAGSPEPVVNLSGVIGGENFSGSFAIHIERVIRSNETEISRGWRERV